MSTPDWASALGEVIRRQREMHDLSLRQFAELAGISNPYLSQIEHGRREPSRRVVEAIARSLQMTPEALYAAAGITPEEPPAASDARAAIAGDPALTPRQRRALIELYDACRRANADGARAAE
jgi:transcriptional regulator with XRE-family HTH domain